MTRSACARLDGFGSFERAELAAAGALLDYLELTQKGVLPRLSPPRRIEPDGILQIDGATRRNLELTGSLAGTREGSLLHAIDRTVTGAGARLLAQRVAAPLTDPAAIRARLDAVESLLLGETLREEARALLRRCPDLERALSRTALGRGGPRDLLAIAQAAERAARLQALLAGEPALSAIAAGLVPPAGLAERIGGSLIDEPPLLAREGGFIREGVDARLDELRSLRDAGRQHVVRLEERYRRETAIPSLKIRYNNLIGWFVEVASAHEAKVPAAFMRRQSMAGATRYATTELAELESRIASAAERAVALELELLESLRAAVLAEAARLGEVAGALARADVAAALAELAAEQRYVRPQIDDGPAFRIEGGRHPVVELALARDNQPFVGNDCDLGPESPLWLLTGPNMAGKSTFLRQNALIVVMAQMGSFVPARAATIGTVDRLFSRVGAADDLARGRSTFMVEMVETAAILNLATTRSLVILDEIGRGTATYDGLSIAWAVVEHLHEVNRCRALFATHYHELTALCRPPAPPLLPHAPGQGVAERGRLPARGRPRHRGPLLRHPCRPPRRPARSRPGPGGGGPAPAGGRRGPLRPRPPRRGPAAFRRCPGAGGPATARVGAEPGRAAPARDQSRRADAARGAGAALQPARRAAGLGHHAALTILPRRSRPDPGGL